MAATLLLLLAALAAGSPPPLTVAVLVRSTVPGEAGKVSTPATTRGTTLMRIGCALPATPPTCAVTTAELVQVTVTPPVVALPVVCVPVWLQVQPGALKPVTSRPPGRVSVTVITPLLSRLPALETWSVYSPVLLMVKLPEPGFETVLARRKSTPTGPVTVTV